MKYVLRILLFLSLISTFSAAQSMNRMSHPNQANAKFAQMTDQFVKDSLVLSPVSASQAGYHKHLDPKTGKTIDSTRSSTTLVRRELPLRRSSIASGDIASRPRHRLRV